MNPSPARSVSVSAESNLIMNGAEVFSDIGGGLKQIGQAMSGVSFAKAVYFFS